MAIYCMTNMISCSQKKVMQRLDSISPSGFNSMEIFPTFKFTLTLPGIKKLYHETHIYTKVSKGYKIILFLEN